MDHEKPFLAVYDYGTGGVWAVINAHSKDEILERYPKLELVDSRPPWMSDDEYQEIVSKNSCDIDDEPTGWFVRMTKTQP